MVMNNPNEVNGNDVKELQPQVEALVAAMPEVSFAQAMTSVTGLLNSHIQSKHLTIGEAKEILTYVMIGNHILVKEVIEGR
jgi:hypothetical protein